MTRATSAMVARVMNLASMEMGTSFSISKRIRRELAGEMIDVRELDSTLPPMQITSVTKDGEKHVEYLRLPSWMAADELARLNLPPRPDEVDVSFQQPVRQSSFFRPVRSSSLKPGPTPSPQRSPRHSPQRSPQASPDPNRRLSYGFSEPRELVSTLPALNLTPSASPRPDNVTPSIPSRPELKPYPTEPSIPSWGRPSSRNSNSSSHARSELNVERNAWADDNGKGKDGDEISMTFE